MVAVTQSIEWSAWSRLVGRVRSTSIVETSDGSVLVVLVTIAHVVLTLRIWHDGIAWHVTWISCLWGINGWWICVASIWKLSSTHRLLENVTLWHVDDLAIHVEVLWCSSVDGWHGAGGLLDVVIRNIEVRLSEGTDQVVHAVVGRRGGRSWVNSGLGLIITMGLSLSVGDLLSIHGGCSNLIVVLGSSLGLLLVRHGPLRVIVSWK